MVSASCGTSSLSCRCHTTEALVRELSLGVDPMLKGVQIGGTNKTETLQNMASKNGCQELLCLVLGKKKKMLKNQKRERKEGLQRTRTEETFNKQQLVLGTIVC